MWVFERILAIGGAYRLSYLGILSSSDDEEAFDSTQSVALIEELEFVGQRLDDPHVHELLPRLILLAVRCSRSPGEALRFVFPY